MLATTLTPPVIVPSTPTPAALASLKPTTLSGAASQVAEPPRRARRGLVIAIAGGLVAAAVGIGAVVAFSGSSGGQPPRSATTAQPATAAPAAAPEPPPAPPAPAPPPASDPPAVPAAPPVAAPVPAVAPPVPEPVTPTATPAAKPSPATVTSPAAKPAAKPSKKPTKKSDKAASDKDLLEQDI